MKTLVLDWNLEPNFYGSRVNWPMVFFIFPVWHPGALSACYLQGPESYAQTN